MKANKTYWGAGTAAAKGKACSRPKAKMNFWAYMLAFQLTRTEREFSSIEQSMATVLIEWHRQSSVMSKEEH